MHSAYNALPSRVVVGVGWFRDKVLGSLSVGVCVCLLCFLFRLKGEGQKKGVFNPQTKKQKKIPLQKLKSPMRLALV